MGFKLNYYKHFPKSPKNTHYIYLKNIHFAYSRCGKEVYYIVGLCYYFYYHYSYFPSVFLSYSPHDRDRANASN